MYSQKIKQNGSLCIFPLTPSFAEWGFPHPQSQMVNCLIVLHEYDPFSDATDQIFHFWPLMQTPDDGIMACIQVGTVCHFLSVLSLSNFHQLIEFGACPVQTWMNSHTWLQRLQARDYKPFFGTWMIIFRGSFSAALTGTSPTPTTSRVPPSPILTRSGSSKPFDAQSPLIWPWPPHL